MAGIIPPPMACLADTHASLNDYAACLPEHSREELTGLDRPVQRGLAFAFDVNTIFWCATDAIRPWCLARGLIR